MSTFQQAKKLDNTFKMGLDDILWVKVNEYKYCF